MCCPHCDRAGEVRYALGHRLVDRYLEFVAGRCRPNTLRAVAFDLKAFFAVVAKDPAEVTAALREALKAVVPERSRCPVTVPVRPGSQSRPAVVVVQRGRR